LVGIRSLQSSIPNGCSQGTHFKLSASPFVKSQEVTVDLSERNIFKVGWPGLSSIGTGEQETVDSGTVPRPLLPHEIEYSSSDLDPWLGWPVTPFQFLERLLSGSSVDSEV